MQRYHETILDQARNAASRGPLAFRHLSPRGPLSRLRGPSFHFLEMEATRRVDSGDAENHTRGHDHSGLCARAHGSASKTSARAAACLRSRN
jgi:hypothetical protein